MLRQEGTERPFSSPLNKEYRVGTFSCAGCGTPVFESSHKYDSGTGRVGWQFGLALFTHVVLVISTLRGRAVYYDGAASFLRRLAAQHDQTVLVFAKYRVRNLVWQLFGQSLAGPAVF